MIVKYGRASGFGVDCDIYTDDQKALMPHRNAPLTETGRLRLARCVVDDGWPLRRAAERFQVSPTTAKRWADRYRELGEAGMATAPAARTTAPAGPRPVPSAGSSRSASPPLGTGPHRLPPRAEPARPCTGS